MAKLALVVLLLVISLVASIPAPAGAWSVEGHQLITNYAIEWLPSPWRQFFNYYRWFLMDAVVYPDTVYRETDPNEGPRHYVDLEVWNPNDPSSGTLPQSVEEYAHQMQSAIEGKDWNSVFLFAGRVAHYLGDAAQPYHTTINYNPTNKAGVGLHLVLDSSLVAHLSEIGIIAPSILRQLSPIENLTDFVLSMALQSHSFLTIINQTLINEDLPWSPELTKIIENRTNTAIEAVARVWYTAIAGAKSPAPSIPVHNQLSIAVENVSLTNNGLVTIRIRVVDSLGVSTYANVTLTTSTSIFRGQVANVVPPAGEYVVICDTALNPNDRLTAQREGYATATITIVTTAASVTSIGHHSSATASSARRVGVPTVTIVALIVMLGGIFALVVFSKLSRDN